MRRENVSAELFDFLKLLIVFEALKVFASTANICKCSLVDSSGTIKANIKSTGTLSIAS